MQTQSGFGFLELLVNHTAENQLLVGGTQRLWGEVDAALGQFGEVRRVAAGGDEGVRVLSRAPDREVRRAAFLVCER